MTKNSVHLIENIENAEQVKHELMPLRRPAPEELPYPKESLGFLRPVVDALHETVQAPYAMCAGSVLAVASLTVQGHANVQMPVGGPKPISNFFVTVGATGERKSATDDLALGPVRKKEEELKRAYDADLVKWRNKKDAWEQERQTIIKKSKTSQSDMEARLDRLGTEPQPPMRSIITFPEPTLQGLIKYFEDGYPSVGLFSAEGGQFVGGHAMKEDNKMETAAGFNALWDGTNIKRIRAGDGSTFLIGRRLSMHIMMQPEVATRIMTDHLLDSMGFLGRVLVAFPSSTQGKRFYKDVSSASKEAMVNYETQMRAILDKPLPLAFGTKNQLALRTLVLSPAAQQIWIDFDTDIEKQRGENGHYSTISGFANKLPEHATRLAAVLALFENIDASEISALHMKAGIELALYYAREAMRLKEYQFEDKKLMQAERLIKWMKEKEFEFISLHQVYQFSPIQELRTAKSAREIMCILQEHEFLEFVGEGLNIDGAFRKEVWRVIS